MRKLVPATLCALALALAACGGDAAETDTAGAMMDTGMMAPAPMAADTAAMGGAAGGATDMLVADVDSVIAGAQTPGGITSIPPAVAVPIIQRIEDALDATNVEALDEIATDLESLREELGGDVNGAEVGAILVRLGDKVTAFAPQAGVAQERLTTLGGALTTQGRALAGGE